MKYGKLVAETKEHAFVTRIIAQAGINKDAVYKASIKKLWDELKTAVIYNDADVPKDVVRLNAEVTIQTPDNKQKQFKLVMPEKSNIAENKLSILAPMGLALFGYAEGDEVLWQFPSGMSNIKIVKVDY